MDTSKLKPFNLSEALAGKPVVNGMGDKVVITKFSLPITNGTELVSQDSVSGSLLAYHYADGRTDSGSGLYKLYMAPVPRTVWVNLYPNENPMGPGYHAAHHDTEGDANKRGNLATRIGNKAHPITFTE